MDKDNLEKLIKQLIKEPQETEWLEFKLNNSDPERIGEILSGLANSANLNDQPFGYLVFGVDDKTHEIIGTKFNPITTKVKNHEFENWINQRLTPRLDLEIYCFKSQDKNVVIFQVPAATDAPVRFQNMAFVRVGTITRKLQDFPVKERKIWLNAERRSFESALAASDISEDEVLEKLDYPGYFSLTERPLPSNKEKILEKLLVEKIIVKTQYGYGITNLGAVLFAKNIENFDSLKRKAVRVVLYKGKNKVEAIREISGKKGYAIGFNGLMDYIVNLLPANEALKKAIRVEEKMYPPIAIRELIANALIHQDFTETGTGPMIEIFEDRIEISDPGKPLVNPIRFIGHPPKSRNEKLAFFMRRMKMCEERGSGVAKVIHYCEIFQLPAPKFEETDTAVKVTLFAHKSLKDMDKDDKIRACYQHCCLKYVSGSQMTNESLRTRFGIEKKNYSTASRIIDEAIQDGLIKPYDPGNKSRKHAKYVPAWA